LLQDVPIAVSAFSAAKLEQMGAVDITALQQTTPNLTLQIARGSNSTLIAFIRGIGQQDPLWGFEPGVGLYVDDVYVARPQGAVLDIFDIQRIEVLRGPQGTLYGRNTIGGAVKYVTRPLSSEPELTAKVNLGSFAQHDVILTGSTPVTDSFSIGGAAAIYRRNGYGSYLLTGAEHYNKDVDAFRVSAELKPTDTLSFKLSGDYVNDKSNARHGHREVLGSGLAAGEVILNNVYDTRAGIGNANKVKNKGASLLVQWDANEQFTFKATSAWRQGSTDTLIDFDNGPTPALDVPGYYRDRQFTQELQLLFNGERIQAVGGLFYMNAAASGAFDTVLGIANLVIATSGAVHTDSLAGYADVSFKLTDQWSLSVGGRYTQDKKTGSVYRQNFTGLRSPLFGNPAAIPGLLRTNYSGKQRTFSEFTPRVSLSWEPSDTLTTYLSWGRGFKSGGFDMRGDAYIYPQTVNGYNPELVDTTELGLKGASASGRVHYAAAVFDSKYKDQQITTQVAVLVPAPAIASFVDNAASSSIRGVEFEGSFAVTSGLAFNLQAGFIDAKFNDYVTFDATTGTRTNLASQRAFQNTPKFSGSIGLTMSTPLAGGEMSFSPSISYRGSYQLFEQAIPLLDQGAYRLVNASIGWTNANEKLNVALHGLNLTDEHYHVGGYNFPGATFGNSVDVFYGPPRTFTLSASYKFN
jgi:iron complex outermembrane receptor protein